MPANFIDCKSSQAELDKDYKFIHLDANKSFKGTLDDLTKYSAHCSGVICVDDYLQSMWPEVTRAVDVFVNQTDWKRILIGNHQVFLSRKITPAVKQIAIDFPVAMVNGEIFLTYGKLPTNNLFEKTISNVQEVQARNGKVLLITDDEGASCLNSSEISMIKLPKFSNFIAPIIYAIPSQLIAYYTALYKGTDIDQPRNLAKSVTVE